jgi:hypothetical protein
MMAGDDRSGAVKKVKVMLVVNLVGNGGKVGGCWSLRNDQVFEIMHML